MSQDSLRRAYRALQARPGGLGLVHLLSVLEALLALALIGVVALMIALAGTRGVTRLRSEHFRPVDESGNARPGGSLVPGWLNDRVPLVDARGNPIQTSSDVVVSVPETGLYPVVAEGRISSNPLHRFTTGIIDLAIRVFRPLRENVSALVTLIMLGLLLLLALSSLSRLRRRLAIDEVLRATESLRVQLHRQIYRLGQSYLPGEGLGPVINIFTRDVNELRNGLLADLLSKVHAPVLGAGLLLIAFAISPVLAIFILSLAGVIWLISGPLDRARRVEVDTAARSSAIHLLQLHEDLSMLRTVRVFGIESIDRQRFEEHLALFQAADRQRMRGDTRLHPTFWLMLGVMVLLAIGMLAHAVLTSTISMHGAVVLTGALLGLAWPVSEWLRRRGELDRAARSAAGIEEYLDRKPELQMTVGARFLPPIREKIELQDVTLEGPAGQELLHRASLTIPARTRTALLSLDEDAKHALVCLIPRLIDPKSGRVAIDGVDLREVTLESLRAQVALALQADYVFSDSVSNNIGLGDASFSLPRIIEAAKAAHAHHFIQKLPQGYDTVIGPLGHPLTLDEQFRVALARALLHDPSIVIVEEPNMALDEDVKHLIDDTIDRLAKHRTVIFLPHRLSTIRKCDQVIVLHNGRIEATGAPRDMHGRSKLFRHIQYVEFNQFASGEIEAGQLS